MHIKFLFVAVFIACCGHYFPVSSAEEEGEGREWVYNGPKEDERDEESELEEMASQLQEIVKKQKRIPRFGRPKKLVRTRFARKQKRDDVNPTDFLAKFGYLPQPRPGVSFDAATKTSAIRKFQQMYHLEETGKLNDETIEAMTMPRCGVPDIVKNKKTKRFDVPGYKWKKNQLKWRLHNFWNSPSLNKDTQRKAITEAFNLWSQVVPLNFVETNGDADFNLKFAYRDHGDGAANSFDGPNGVLAHAYFPESGELHFDSEEAWTDGVDSGINLKIVTAHELGHAIGLGHSNVQGALMAPYYAGYEENFKLRYDDIAGAQTLYGGRPQNDPPATPAATAATRAAAAPTTTPNVARTTPTPAKNPSLPDSCDLVYKAITQTHDGRICIFNGDKMWRASDYSLDEGFPTPISTTYELSPSNIDAAVFSWKTYYTYFFKDSDVWVYFGTQLVLHKKILNSQYPANPTAAFPKSDGGPIWLLKNNYLYEFDEGSFDLSKSASPVAVSSVYPNLPPSFNTILRVVRDPYLYIFSGTQYYKYDPAKGKILDGYPKPNKAWMGKKCGFAPFIPK